MPTWKMMYMQDPATLTMIFMANTHNIIMEVMVVVAVFILVMMMWLLLNKSINRKSNQSSLMEILWTILPMSMLIYMAAPSIQLLYILEEQEAPTLTVKALGNQWYWIYQYPDLKKEFTSSMLTDKIPQKFRLMDVDNRLILPYKIYTRILCSSNDVIHSWTVPAMGLKMDALPGRINQLTMIPSLMGVFFGQCSEICGMKHSFMPIVVEVVSVKMFINWIKK